MFMVNPAQNGPGQSISQYDLMVIESHNAPAVNNILVAVSNWVFFAGFIVFPGTFRTIGHSNSLGDSDAGRLIQDTAQNVPLLVIGCLSCSIGAIGIAISSWKLKRNYAWIIDHILLPGIQNTSVSLLAMLINVYTAQGGKWSQTAIVSFSIASSYGFLMVTSLFVFEFGILKRLRNASANKRQVKSRQF